MANGNIFISYRRGADSSAAGRLHDRLERTFDDGQLFFDVDAIPLGVDFKDYIDGKVGECDVLLVLIGQGWLDSIEKLSNPHDFVRIEVEAALGRSDIPVIPVLFDGVTMPAAEALPEKLRPLVRRNAIAVSHDQFAQSVDGRLTAALQGAIAHTEAGIAVSSVSEAARPDPPNGITDPNEVGEQVSSGDEKTVQGFVDDLAQDFKQPEERDEDQSDISTAQKPPTDTQKTEPVPHYLEDEISHGIHRLDKIEERSLENTERKTHAPAIKAPRSPALKFVLAIIVIGAVAWGVVNLVNVEPEPDGPKRLVETNWGSRCTVNSAITPLYTLTPARSREECLNFCATSDGSCQAVTYSNSGRCTLYQGPITGVREDKAVCYVFE